MSLRDNFESVMATRDLGVPTHMGFSLPLTMAIADYKMERTAENKVEARRVLEQQEAGEFALSTAIEELIAQQK